MSGVTPGQNDNVTVIVGGTQFGGWQSVQISRSCEHMPSSFNILATQNDPTTGALAQLPPGSPCTVMIGPDPVLVGYIDRFMPSINPRSHQVQIQGRGKCEDLVDCSINGTTLNGMQVTTSSLLNLAQTLCKPFGAPPPINVRDLTGTGVPVSSVNSAPLTFNATLQQTPWELLEEVARYAGVLVYEGTDGSLVIASVGGEGTMASGFAQGTNVQAASTTFTMDQRYSIYEPCLMSTNMFGQEGIGGTQFPPAYDSGVPRFRPLIIVSEQLDQNGQYYAETRAKWEAARRLGRSQALRVTCDSWRDSAGRLWAPNAFASIDIPALQLASMPAPWIISSVDFVRDGSRGTVADLVLMPKEAFTPEPEILVPFFFNPGTSTGAVPAAGGGAGKSFTGEGSVENPPAAPATPAVPPAGGGATSLQ